MADTDYPTREQIMADYEALKENFTPSGVAKIVTSLLAVADADPGKRSQLAQLVEESPDVRKVFHLAAISTLLTVVDKSTKIGTTIADILAEARPYYTSEKDREGLVDIHALMQINRALEMLFGEGYHPSLSLADFDPKDLIAKSGLTSEQMQALPLGEVLTRIMDALPRPPILFIDSLHDAADLVFEQRYGWPQGTAKNMKLVEIWFALEHALDDKSGDPTGIWKLTE
jgi:hypothetical protein